MFDFETPGEQAFKFQGQSGQLEAILHVPPSYNHRYIALIGHPHSLQGGTMNNKVVTTLVRMFKELGIASIRFNFRGVGQSQGEYDSGFGESDDMRLLTESCVQQLPDVKLIFAGFSFGSYVAYRTAAQYPSSLLISIAPPVHHYDFNEFAPIPHPWIIVHGDQDEVVPIEEVYPFVSAHPSIIFLECADTTHFFHGKLIELKTLLMQTIQNQGLLCL